MSETEKNCCYNGGKKHNYQPRYSEENSDIKSLKLRGITLDEIKGVLVLKKYCFDICTWCGNIKSNKSGECK